MSILAELKDRFRKALAGLTDAPDEVLDMIRLSQDPKFGDYQANLAMPLAKRVGRAPRDVAAEIVGRLDIADLCHAAQIAGPGFINLRLRDEVLTAHLTAAVGDPRLGIPAVERPRTYVVDYSAPNVAKPMHVGHIRSTVIGYALDQTLRFLGHRVISDNHIGDWGTQFGMIIYGYRHFRDDENFRRNPVAELAGVYRRVQRLMDYHESLAQLPKLRDEAARQAEALADRKKQPGAKQDKALRKAETSLAELRDELAAKQAKIAADQADAPFMRLAQEHAQIESAVLAETAKLHAGDEENLRLWRQFLPACLDEIQRVYTRLGVAFDHTLGESFYHPMLEPIVEELCAEGIAETSEGAACVFSAESHREDEVPMIIRKQDGAFLYATTDLATIRYRVETWRPDAILYVVDHRQSLHFQQLFATARRMGYDEKALELVHVSFGAVLGDDGRPFKTRSGETVGLEGLLDEAVRRAAKIVAENDDALPGGPELSAEERARVAEYVGIAALKYADLSQNRTSDYVFSYDKMLAMTGNTATYMQYAYARVCSIFAKGGVDVAALRRQAPAIQLAAPAERSLALALSRSGEALDLVVADYRPNQLTSYLFELANCYSTFFEQCPVLKAENPALRQSRLTLCDLTARTIRLGLQLLGIRVVEKM